MQIVTDQAAIDEVTSRSIDKIYPTTDAFKAALKSGKQLSFYVGIDPTADYVHLGHSTNYLIMERLHKMGHRIIVLVGDFTAMIGDPSDKTSMRVQLTPEQVQTNLQTFKDQIGKILDFETTDNPIEFKFNSEWLSKLNFQDCVELASNFTVQQMLERDAFQKRVASQKPLYIHEFFYPFMQGYDSVAMDVDAEIGGTDQTFNMLAGRTLLKRYKDKDKFVIATTLLENPETGEKLMSKSLGTGVGLNESAKDMFIKTMRLPDPGIMQTFVDCTRLGLAEIETLRDELSNGANPRDIKLRLAHEVVLMYHGAQAADDAQAAWINEVANKQVAQDVAELKQSPGDNLIDVITDAGVADSKSKVRRLIQDGVVKADDVVITIEGSGSLLAEGTILSVGKKHTFKIIN